MKLLLDARKLGDGGIGVYIETLVDGLLEFQDKVSITLLVSPEFYQAEGDPRRCRWRKKVSLVQESASKYSVSEYLFMVPSRQNLFDAHDIFHSPHYTLPFFLKIPSVVTVHDVIHVTHPENFYHKPVARRLIRSALRRATQIITVSQESADTLRLVAPEQTSQIPPVHVVPIALREGVQRSSEQETALCLKKHNLCFQKFGLFVGSERPHKGLRELLVAWSNLKRFLEQGGKTVPKLALVGVVNSEALLEMLCRLHLDDIVEFLGEVCTEELNSLYSGAKLVALPSRVEGFGLVALEALACGAPLVSTPLPSVQETVQECAWFAEDFSSGAFFRALCVCLEDLEEAGESLVQRLSSGTLRASEFSPAALAEKTLEVYAAVLGKEGKFEETRVFPSDALPPEDVSSWRMS